MNALTDKRLVVVSNVHPVHDGRTYYRQAHFAAQQGMQVDVLALDDGHANCQITIQPFTPPKSRFRRFLLGWRIAYQAFRRRADIYHFHDPEMLLPMTLLRLLTRRTVIYDCHENVVDSIHYKPYLPRVLRPALACLVFGVQWACAKILGRVIVATDEQLEMFPKSVSHLVLRNFPPEYIQVESEHVGRRPYDLVHCGSLSIERGSHVMLEALRVLVEDHGRKDCKLLLVGVERSQLDPQLNRFIEKHQLEENLEFRPFVPLEEVPRLLCKAKIGLMCHQATRQYRYGVASKLFDYMASGLAIVGGRADFDAEYAPEGTVKVYVDQTSPTAYAEAIDQLLTDQERLTRMGGNASRLYREKYTAEREADRLIRFYQRSLTVREAA